MSESTKPRTRKQAIEAYCRSCVYDPANAGTWRQQVTLCACRDCVLWPWRPVSRQPLPAPLRAAYGLTDAAKLRHEKASRRDSVEVRDV